MTDTEKKTITDNETAASQPPKDSGDKTASAPKEIGGRAGPEPTRYGDWENNGIASDF